MRKRGGFNLIELGVALAIVAVVAAILLSGFANARGQAMKSSCLANMKSHGLHLAQYCTDYNNRLPLYDNGTDPKSVTSAMGVSSRANHPLIDDQHPADTDDSTGMPYWKNAQTLICPSDPHRQRKLSYTLNGLFLGFPQDEIVKPETKIMEIDECSVTDFVFLRYTAGQYVLDHLAEPGNFVHLHGLNAIYADGHGHWLYEKQWPQGPSDPNFAWFQRW